MKNNSTGGVPGFVHRHKNQLLFLMRVSLLNMALLSISLLLHANATTGQNLDKIMVTIEAKNESLETVLERIREKTELHLTYLINHIEPYDNITLPFKERSAKETLALVLAGTELTYRQSNSFILIEKKSSDIRDSSDEISVFQAITVAGTVTDGQNNQPMAGVNVVVKGTTRGTTTDTDGKFRLDVEDNDILVFSFIGFKTFEAQVSGRTIIDVILAEDIEALNEVVINAGYWQVSQREKTGSISRITSEEIKKQQTSNPIQAMQGRIPGMFIRQITGTPGSNFQIQIRGINSLANGNDPLYVIDGVPFISESLSHENAVTGLFGLQGVSPLYSINPDDIESIEILKDADATAIYGSRGANGVVLITTKRGKPGKTTFDFNFNSGFGQVGRFVDLLNSTQYLEMRREAFKNDNLEITDFDLLEWDTTRYTNWQKKLIGGTANTLTAQISVSGGTDLTQFNLSGGYQKQSTVFPGDNYSQKGSTHFSINHRSPNQKFNVRTSTSYNINGSNISFSDFTTTALTLPPIAPKIYDDGGNLNWENSTWSNPLASLERRYLSRTTNLLSNLVLGYNILHNLNIQTSIGVNDIQTEEKATTPSTFFNPEFNVTPASSNLWLNDGRNRSYIIEPQVNWNKQLTSSKLFIILGGTIQDRRKETTLTYLEGFSSDVLIEDPNSAKTVDIQDYVNIHYKYSAIYGRINFNLNDKYIINLTGRRDGSSRFGPGKRFANFGALGAAWIFSNENFTNNFEALSFGKLRASYGITGNDQIGDYSYLDTYRSAGSYQGFPGLVPARLFNPDYSWETNKKFEMALELGFINDRITLDIGYYNNRSSNQLIDDKLPSTTGFPSMVKNFEATVQNTGIEIDLNTVNINNGRLKWVTSFNLTFPRNKLVDFPNLEGSSYASRYEVGKPLSIRKKMKYAGLEQDKGIYLFEDSDDDGAVTFADRNLSIDFGQKYYGGINNSLTIHKFQLDILLQFVRQSGDRYAPTSIPGSMANQPTSIMGRWQQQGDDKDVQKLTTGYDSEAFLAFFYYIYSDAVVQNTSFIRLKSLSLSYTLSPKWMNNVSSRFYLQGQNLFTITDYSGLDPETGSSAIAPLRTFTIGVQITL